MVYGSFAESEEFKKSTKKLKMTEESRCRCLVGLDKVIRIGTMLSENMKMEIGSQVLSILSRLSIGRLMLLTVFSSFSHSLTPLLDSI